MNAKPGVVEPNVKQAILERPGDDAGRVAQALARRWAGCGHDRSRSARAGHHEHVASHIELAHSYTGDVPIYRLPREPFFPEPCQAEPDGLLAVGGDLSPERLLQAYAAGIFPWFSEGSPILWWSPDPRLVLEPPWLHVPRSLARTARRGRYVVAADTAFTQVIRRCADKARPGQDGTWITAEMAFAYERLHRLGFAHSFEAWDGPALAGGLYGVSLGGAFFGESMFADRPDASKVAFVRAVGWLAERGMELIDCQVKTEHLTRFGAREIPREDFLSRLERALLKPTLRGRWDLENPVKPPPAG